MSINHRTQPLAAPTDVERDRAAWADEQAARARRRVKSLSSLHSAAEAVRIFGWLIAACGIAVGFIAVLSADTEGTGYGVAGVAVVLGSLLFGAVLNLAGRWADAWAEHADR
jgi:hypothetical protein